METQLHDPVRQRQQVLTLLRLHAAMTTDEFRSRGIMAPAPRVLELRRQGYQIITERVRVTGLDGRLHTQARYVLLGRGAK